MKRIRTILAGIGISLVMAVGFLVGAAPAQASPGDYVVNYGSSPLILVLDGGTYTYAYKGDTYNYVSYVAIPPRRCLYTPYNTNWWHCNYSYSNHLYYDVPNGVYGFALGYVDPTLHA